MHRSRSLLVFAWFCCWFASTESLDQAKGPPNVILARDWNNAWCVAQGEEVFSGLTWNSPVKPSVCLQEIALNTKHMVKMEQAAKTNTILHPLRGEQWDGLIDYRWNDLPLLQMSGENEFSEESIPIKMNEDLWKLTFSILSDKDAFIYLCDGTNPYSSDCYWIIIGGWANHLTYRNGRCALMRCTKGAHPPNVPYGTKHCPDLKRYYDHGLSSLQKWIHITVIAKYEKNYRGKNLYLKVLHDNVIILEYRDDSPPQLKYLNFRSDSVNTFFRIHNYTYALGASEKELVSETIMRRRRTQCWNIEYNFLEKHALSTLDLMVRYDEITTEGVQSLKHTEGKWKVRNVTFDSNENHKQMRFVFKGKHLSSFAVGNIRRCNVTSYTRVSPKLHYKTLDLKKNDLNCQSLKYPDYKVSVADVKDCGDDCRLSCKALNISDLSSCKGVTLCRITPPATTSTCFCSSEFYGQTCTNHYLFLKKPPESKASTSSSITIAVNDFEINGEGTPTTCSLQYMLNERLLRNEDEWTTYKTFGYNSPQTYDICDLEKGKEYAFRVVLSDESGQTYTEKVPYSVYSACNRPQEKDIQVHRTSTSIKIHWETGSEEYTCPLSFYNFTVGTNNSSIQVNGGEKLPIEIRGLEPNTEYYWTLSYRDAEMYQGRVTTLPGVPSALESENEHPTGFRIKWQEPRNTMQNTLSYHITYKHLRYISCPEEEQNSEEMFNDTSHLHVDLEGLKPYSAYKIRVAACATACGDPVERVLNTTGHGTLKFRPRYDPKNIKIGQNSVEVFWTEDCTMVQGKIINYNVTLIGRSEWAKDTIRKRDWKQGRPSAKFEKLVPYTDYEVVVLAEGEDGPVDEQYALTINFTTLSSEPGVVRNATAYSFGDDWISLRWEAPCPPLAKLESYEVEITGMDEPKSVDLNNRCRLWKEKICTEFHNLQNNQAYNIKIYAKGTEGRGKATELSQTTKEEAPDPPALVDAVALSPQEIKVTWSHPNITRGKIRYFIIHAQINTTGLRKNISTRSLTLNKTISEETTQYCLQMKNLLPASRYTLSVTGVTVSEGKSNLTSANTFIAVPDIGPHLKLKSGSETNTSFDVWLPSTDEDILTDKSAYIIIVTSVHKEYNRQLDFSDLGNEMVTEILKKTATLTGRASWIAAEVQPTNKETSFTIGENSTRHSGGHFVRSATNYALEYGGSYQVTLIAICAWENEYNYSIASLERLVHIGAVSSSYAAGDVVGWVILALVLICIPVVLFFIIKRRKTRKAGDMIELKQEDILAGIREIGVDGITAAPELEGSEEVSPGPKQPPSQRFSRKVAIADLEQYIRNGLASGELQRQHSLFPRGQTRAWEYGQLPQNKTKNRYGNLVAYDVTRVQLKKLPDDPYSDYINANYIDGYKSPRFYIATQGPKRNTVNDFWRMVWQENVQVIAMMTNLFESGKLKCDKYWPDLGHEVTYGAITILTASNQIFADYTFRILNVSSKGKTRKIHQLHFTSWPDHGVPLYTQSVASYLKKLLAVYPGSGPIVVHCSAGVGRTGTIILTDICLRMAAAEGCVDVLSFQQHIREQRANMVDNLEQYKLVHLVLLECLVLEPSSYPCDANFEKLVQELSTSGAIESQYKRLHERNWQDLALREFLQDQVSQTDTSKNRNLNIVPSSHGQVHISSYPAHQQHSDYINAVYVDGFRAKDQFVVTQFPLQSTIGDFWRLIHEKNISLIVVLNEIDEEEDKSVCKFWPQEQGESLTPVPYISLTKKTEDDSTQWKTHSLSVNTTQSAGPTESTTVRVLHLKGWKAQDQLPPSPDVIIELWQEAERLYKGKQPIVVCCLNGATASGFFVALAFLIEKIKLEQQCDVCQAVRTVRQNREQFVPTCEQFQCLYNAAVSYLDSFQTYANFN